MSPVQSVTVGVTSARVMIRGHLEHVSGFDALTPSGAGFAAGETPYATRAARYRTARWEALREALLRRDCAAIVQTAAKLPSVRVALDTRRERNPNYGFTVSWRGWKLFCAPVVAG